MRLIQLGKSAQILPSEIWVKPSGLRGLTQALERPDEPGWRSVTDLKSKVLDDGRDKEDLLFFDPPVGATRVDLFRRLLVLLRDRGLAAEPSPIAYFAALPALHDDSARREYRRLIEETFRTRSAIGSSTVEFLFEPDAVLQYFRLVREEVKPRSKGFEAYLVVDSGAGTTNFSVVFKPKTATFSAASTGRSRGPLQAVAAEAPLRAGNWVDEQIVALLRDQVDRAKSEPGPGRSVGKSSLQHDLWRTARQLKEQVSRLKKPQRVVVKSEASASEPVELRLTPLELTRIVGRLWEQLDRPFGNLLERVYGQLAASKRYEGELASRAISSADKVPLLFSYVILAGGSSQLPGFRDGLLRRLGTAKPEMLAVGPEDFRIAVAAGLAAHAIELLERSGSEAATPESRAGAMVRPTPEGSPSTPAPGPDGPAAAPATVAAASESRVADAAAIVQELRKKLESKENTGIVRLQEDLDLVYRSLNGDWRRQRLFEVAKFPLAYERDSAAREQRTIDLKPGNKGRAKQWEFGIAPSAAATASAPTLPAGLLTSADGQSAEFTRVSFAGKVTCAPLFDPISGAIIVELRGAETTGPGDPQRPFATLHRFVGNQFDTERAAWRAALRHWERTSAPRSGRALATDPQRDVVPTAATPTLQAVVRPVPTSAAPSGSPPAGAPSGPPVCLDIGTSKLVAVLAVPPLAMDELDAVESTAPSEDAAEGFDGPERGGQVGDAVVTTAPRPEGLPQKPEVVASAGEQAGAALKSLRTVHEGAELQLSPGSTPPTPLSPPPSVSPVRPDPTAERIAELRAAVARAGSVACWRPVSESEVVEHLISDADAAGLRLPAEVLRSIYLSLKSRSILVLSGPPGIGKSSVARIVANSLGATHDRGTLQAIAVEACWTDSSYLLGSGTLSDGAGIPRFAQLAISVDELKDQLGFAVLEEFNLAHPEYYLAQILSNMEHSDPVGLGHPELCVPLPMKPPHHRLLMFGTMNVDDASTLLSDKVLDRSNVVELPVDEPGDSIASEVTPLDAMRRGPLSAAVWAEFCKLPASIPVPPLLRELWALLAQEPEAPRRGAAASSVGASRLQLPLGSRVVRDIAAYLFYAAGRGRGEALLSPEVALDMQVCQRVLPRIRGEAVGPLLSRLDSFCKNNGLQQAERRISRMLSTLQREHYTSFWIS